jgi:uncharacterized integral membrane protein
MKEIRIPVPLALLLLLAAIAGGVISQMPEIERYLKVKSM